MKKDMKAILLNNKNLRALLFTFILCILASIVVTAQDSAASAKPKAKPVKNTFGSSFIIDNQSVMVPIKGTFEADFQHRFGTVNNGFDDLWGLYAPSNIRLGVNYAPIDKLYVGFGLTKDNMEFDFNAKYALLKQTTDDHMPVSVTVYGNMAIDARDAGNFENSVDRYSYFSQLIIARKITEKFSAQLSPSFSWFNNVEGYIDSKGQVQDKMYHGHFAIALYGRYKVGNNMSILAGWDQPLTQHPLNNPHPNICLGLEITTSAHQFQIITGNYHSILAQRNNVFNQNDFTQGQFLIGFNITRLWNF